MINLADMNRVQEFVGAGAVDFFGRPGAGKDEQAKRLAKTLGGLYISSGLIFRNDPNLSAEQRALMEAGGIVNTSEYERKILPVFGNPDFQGKPFALSSVGRKRGEEEPTRQALIRTGHPLRMVVHLVFGEEQARERLVHSDNREPRGGRADDSAEAIDRRMVEFEKETIHVIDHFDALGYVEEIDASLPIEDVEIAVLEALASRAERN